MLRHPLLAVAVTASLLTAQDSPTVQAAGRIRVAGLPKLAAQWPETRLGRLFADPEVAPAVDKVLQRHIAELTRRRLTAAAAMSGAYELEPWLLSWVVTGRFDPLDVIDTDVTEAEQTELLMLMVPDQPFAMATALVRSCTPRHEGQWTMEFEAEAQRLRSSTDLREQSDAKVDGLPAYCFVTIGDEQHGVESTPRWMVHLPGRFVRVNGTSADGVLALLSTRSAPGISMSIDTAALMQQFARQQHTPEEFSLLGFDRLASFEWRAAFAGEHVLDEIVAVTEGEPGGLIGAIVNGEAALPAQPLPDGALAQLRLALDVDTIVAMLLDPSLRLGLQEPMLAQFRKAITGGIALGICAPPPGGLIPRVHLSIGVGDREALDGLLAALPEDELPRKAVEYEGVPCTVLQLPDVPNGLQPTFCIVGETLHLTESPRTMRKFLQLLEDGGEAMAIGDIAPPDGPGEVMSTVDLRFDEVAIYRAFHDTWLPLLTLALGADGFETVLLKDDLPDPDTVAEHCGFGRGVLRRDGKTWRLQQQGTFGGIETLALTLLWGPMLAAQMRDSMTDNLAEAIAAKQLATVHEAFAAFEKREQRRPKDLAELFAAQRLPADALLLPGDDLAEPLQLADGTTTRCSYRYFPATTRWQGDDDAAILIEVRPHRYQRSVLTAQGAVLQDYGPDSRKPIDEFPGAAGR